MGDTEGLSFPESAIYPQTSMGYDGTNGNQPRFLNISYNLAHEIGIHLFHFIQLQCINITIIKTNTM